MFHNYMYNSLEKIFFGFQEFVKIWLILFIQLFFIAMFMPKKGKIIFQHKDLSKQFLIRTLSVIITGFILAILFYVFNLEPFLYVI